MNSDPDLEDDDLDADPLAEDDDTFEDANDEEEASEEFEEYDEPPILYGVFRGHVAATKPNPKNPKVTIITIVSQREEHKGSDVAWFMDPAKRGQTNRLKKFLNNMGIETPPNPSGKGWTVDPLWRKQILNVEGVFVSETYHKPDGTINSSLAWGMPKPNKSPEWDDYAKEANFTDDQIKAITASPGVIHPDSAALFDE